MSTLDKKEPVDDRGEVHEWRGGGGRTVLFAALGYGAGPVLLLSTAGVFVRPTMEATGWSTSEVLFGPIVSVLFLGFAPLVGRIADRRGVRSVLVFGLLSFVALMVIFAMVPINKITFYGLAVCIGAFGSFAGTVPYNQAVALWFDKGAGKAFGLVGVGLTALPIVALPLITWVIYATSWRVGYLVLAGFALLIALPSAVFGIKRPEVVREIATASHEVDEGEIDRSQSPVDPKKVMRSPRFGLFVLSIALTWGTANAFVSQVQPLLLDAGITVAVATTLTIFFTIGSLIGRLGVGVLLDILSRYVVAIGMLVLSAAGALILSSASIFPIVVIGLGVMLLALIGGAEGDVIAYFILKEYGRLNFGLLFSVAMATGGVLGTLVPYLITGLRDATGSYLVPCLTAAGLLAGAILALSGYGLLGRRSARRDVATGT